MQLKKRKITNIRKIQKKQKIFIKSSKLMRTWIRGIKIERERKREV